MTDHADGDLAARLDEALRLVRDEGADASALYRRWFHRETGALETWPHGGAYRAAILRPESFQSGWSVVGPAAGPAGAVVARRGEHQRVVAPPELIPDDPRQLAPGPGASVRVQPLISAESGGFWHLWSVGWQAGPPDHYRRLYLHLTTAAVLDVVTLIVTTAPSRPVWAMKALCGTHRSGRRDGALLYLPVEMEITSSWVAHLVDGLRPHCVDGLPPFVDPVGPGTGWAPDPGGGRSFGEAVCAAVASAAGHTGDATAFVAAALAAVRALPGMDASPQATPLS